MLVLAGGVAEVPPLAGGVRPFLLPAELGALAVDRLRHAGLGDVDGGPPPVVRGARPSGQGAFAGLVEVPEVLLFGERAVGGAAAGGADPDAVFFADVVAQPL